MMGRGSCCETAALTRSQSGVATADRTVGNGWIHLDHPNPLCAADPHHASNLGDGAGYQLMAGGVDPNTIFCYPDGTLHPDAVQALQPRSSSQHGLEQYLTDDDDANSSVRWFDRWATAEMGAEYGDQNIATREIIARQVAGGIQQGQ